MIQELLTYFEKDHYQNLDRDVEKAFDDYQSGLSVGGEEGQILKDKSRRKIESQLVDSGQMEEESAFINLEEFFPGGERDETKIEDFRRNMTMAHSGQQMLWSFAGTTGAMTVLTEKHLESLGRSLDDLKPAGMKRREAKRRAQKHAIGPDTVRLYLYGDGTASQEYDKEKARIRFDRMRDTSGFNWNQKSYDRNYKVEKSGWFGALNEEGEWVRVDYAAQEGPEGVKASSPEGEENLKLIYTLDGALLFDLALILGGQEKEEYYYTLEGDLYGAVKTDREETAKRLKEALKGTEPVGIVLPAGTDEGVKDVYRKELGETALFFEAGSEEVERLLEEDAAKRQELAAGSLLLGAVSRLKQAGLEEEAIREALESEGETVVLPCSPFIPEDREILAPELSEEAAAWLDRTGKEATAEEKALMTPAVSGVLPLLALAGSSGLDEVQMLEEARSVALGREFSTSKPTQIKGTVTLGEMAGGKDLFPGYSSVRKESKSADLRTDSSIENPKVASETAKSENGVLENGASLGPKSIERKETPDFFQVELEQTGERYGLSEGEIGSFQQAMERVNIPPVNRKDFNRMMDRLLTRYRPIQMSTGMTLFDLTSAVDSMAMKRPDAARFSGKTVHFEEDLREIISRSSSGAGPVKHVKKEELFQPLWKEEGEPSEGAETKVSEEDKALTVRLLEEQGYSDSKDEILKLLDEGNVTSNSEIPFSEILESHLSEMETAPEITQSVLSIPSEATDEPLEVLSDRQLALLKGMYLSYGAGAEQAEEAVQLWRGKSFTKPQFGTLKERVESRLASSDPVVRVKKALKEQRSSLGRRPVWNQKEARTLEKRYFSQGKKLSEDLVKKLASWDVPEHSREMVRSVAGKVLEGVGKDHSLTPENLLPAIGFGIAGDWEKVPSELRHFIQNALVGTIGSSTGMDLSAAADQVNPQEIISPEKQAFPEKHMVQVGREEKALAVKLLEEQGYSGSVEQAMEILEEAKVPSEAEVPLTKILRTHLEGMEGAPEITESVFADAPEKADGPLEVVSDRQLALLKSMYLSHGAGEEKAGEALRLWRKRSFTPGQYKTVRQKVKNRMAFSDPVARVKNALEEYGLTASNSLSAGKAVPASEIAKGERKGLKNGQSSDNGTPDSEKSSVLRRLETNASSGVIPEQIVPLAGNVWREDNPVVRDIVQAYQNESGGFPEPAIDLPASVVQALSGQWDNVPQTHRPGLRKILSGRSPSLRSFVPSSSFGSKSRVGGSIEMPRQKKQIPLTSDFDKGSPGVYQKMGYRVTPQTGRVDALKKEGRGQRITPFWQSGQSGTAVKMSTPDVKASKTKNQTSASGILSSGDIPRKLSLLPRDGVTPRQAKTAFLPSHKEVIETVKATIPMVNDHTSGPLESIPHPAFSRTGSVASSSLAGPAPPFTSSTPKPKVNFALSEPVKNTPTNRFDRINANYEADKAALGEMMPSTERMLARSEAMGVGSAGGSGSVSKKNMNKSIDDVFQDFARKMNRGV